jgi:subtilisin family serine protease
VNRTACSIVVCAASFACADDPMSRLDDSDGYLTGSIVVRVAPGIRPAPLPGGAVALVAERKTTSVLKHADLSAAEQSLAAELLRDRVAGIEPALRVTPANAELAAKHRLNRYFRLKLPSTTTAAQALAAMNRLRSAPFASLIETAELEPLGGTSAVPNDPEFEKQYDMHNTGQVVAGSTGIPGADIDAVAGWDLFVGGPITIALLDAGIDQHLDLDARILPGWNAVDGSTNTADVCSSHGTHVAGVAAAKGNNGIGISGLNWNATILPIVVVNGCSGTETTLADGLLFAADSEAKIANMSLQYYTGSTILQDAVTYAVDSGMLLVAATGNFKTNVAFPAKWNKCLAVAATTNKDLRWVNSNPGPQVDVSAPGADVWSLIGSSSYGAKSGTSMATPHVSGLAALIWTLNPNLAAAEVREIIETTVDDVEAPGFDDLTGLGRINVHTALQKTLESLTAPEDLNKDGTVDGADLGLLLAAWNTDDLAADLDDDGEVNGADLGLLLAAWS